MNSNKSILFTILVLFSIAFVSAGPLDYSTGLVSYWTADNTANDAVGSNHGSFAANTYATGIVGQAFDLDGDLDYVEVTHDSSLNLDNFTMSLWVKNNDPGNGDFNQLIGKIIYTGNYFGWGITGTGTDEYRLLVGNAATSQGISSSSHVDSDWHHVVGVKSGTSHYIYVDGVLENSGTNDGIMDSGERLLFGKTYSYSVSSIVYWNGLIDDVAIWNRTLSQSEVSGLYNSYSQQGDDIPEINDAGVIVLLAIVVALVAIITVKKK